MQDQDQKKRIVVKGAPASQGYVAKLCSPDPSGGDPTIYSEGSGTTPNEAVGALLKASSFEDNPRMKAFVADVDELPNEYIGQALLDTSKDKGGILIGIAVDVSVNWERDPALAVA